MSVYYRINLEIEGGDAASLAEGGISALQWSPEYGRLEGTWMLKYASDRAYLSLRSEATEDIRLEWGATFTPLSNGYGPLIGYFNTNSPHLYNSIWVGRVGSRLVAGFGGSDHVVIHYGEELLEIGESVTFTASYAPCSVSGVFEITYTVANLTGGFELLGPIVDDFTVDCFGISNIDLYGCEDLWKDIDPFHFYGAKASISYLEYIDPTIHSQAQLIPAIYSLPNRGEILPLPSQKDGVHYERKGSALNFYNPSWPDVGWAERVYYDNTVLVNTFGRICRILLEEKSHTTDQYKGILYGIMGALWKGPTLGNLSSGMKLLLGLPFMNKDGMIMGINRSATSIVIVVQYFDGNYESFEFPSSYGVANHPVEKDREITVGDVLSAGTPLSGGVDIIDYIKEPDWWEGFGYDEWRKYYTFIVRLQKIHANWTLVSPAVAAFLTNAKPAGTSLAIARDDNTPLFQFDDANGHKEYADVSLVAGSAALVPADYVYTKDTYFYYVSPERVEEILEEEPELTTLETAKSFKILNEYVGEGDSFPDEVYYNSPIFTLGKDDEKYYLFWQTDTNTTSVFESTDLTNWSLSYSVNGVNRLMGVYCPYTQKYHIWAEVGGNVKNYLAPDASDPNGWVEDTNWPSVSGHPIEIACYDEIFLVCYYSSTANRIELMISEDIASTWRGPYPVVSTDENAIGGAEKIGDEVWVLVSVADNQINLYRLLFSTGNLISSSIFYTCNYSTCRNCGIRGREDELVALIAHTDKNNRLYVLTGQDNFENRILLSERTVASAKVVRCNSNYYLVSSYWDSTDNVYRPLIFTASFS